MHADARTRAHDTKRACWKVDTIFRMFRRSLRGLTKLHASRGSNHLRRTPENPLNAHPFKLQCAVSR